MSSLLRISRIGRDHSPESPDFQAQRPNILLSQYLFIGFVAAMVHTGFDIADGLWTATYLDLGIVAILVICYLFNEQGKHLASKILFLGSINLILFVFASLSQRDTGIFLIFFPLIGVAFTVFSRKESGYRLFFVLLSGILLIVLELTGYELFGAIDIQEGSSGQSFLINLILSTVVFGITVNSLIRLNQQAEQALQDNNLKLQQLTEELQYRNVALTKTNKELDSFVYSTSHDLRAPLRSILGLINIAEKEDDYQRIPEYLSMMKESVDKLDLFIKDIIDYSRNSRLEVKKEKIDFEEMITGIIRDHQFLEGGQDIEFNRNIDLEEDVYADKGRLTVILNNLISNAIKYHSPEQKKPKVDLDIISSNGSFRIKIKDNGIGIGPQDQRKVFDMFYRASEQSTGSGLGLYIVKEIVDKLDGDISCHSSPNSGTEFIVDLPA